MKRFLLILLLLASGVFAKTTYDIEYTDTITITSLPYTCSQNLTLYKLSGNLSVSAIRAITVDADSIKISGNNWQDTITFNTGGNAYDQAIRVPSRLAVTLDSLVVIEYDSLGDSVHGISVVGNSSWDCSDITLRECRVHVKSPNSGNLRMTGIINCQVDGGNYTSYVNEYVSRMDDMQRAIYINGYPADTNTHLGAGDYTCSIRKVVIDSCPHTGLGVLQGLFFIDSCYITVNQHNLLYTSYDGLAHSANNCYGIGATALEGTSYIRGCSLRVINSYEGGRGIYMDYDLYGGDYGGANEDSVIKVVDNYIKVNTGPDVEYPTDSGLCWAFRARYGVGNFDFCSNYVEILCDSAVATSAYGKYGVGIFITVDDTTSKNINIYNNHVVAIADSTNYQDFWGEVYALVIVNQDDTVTTNKSYDNYFGSNMYPIKFGRYQAYGASYWRSYRDTLEWYNNRFTDHYDFQGIIGVGFGGTNSFDNRIYDPIFINGNDTDIVYTSDNGVQEAELYVTCTVTVIDSNSTPINNATVYLINTNGDTTSTLTTNASGLAIDTILYWDRVWDDAVEIDTSYNDFTVSGVYSETSADSTIEFTWNNKSITVQLGAEVAAATVRYKLKGVK